MVVWTATNVRRAEEAKKKEVTTPSTSASSKTVPSNTQKPTPSDTKPSVNKPSDSKPSNNRSPSNVTDRSNNIVEKPNMVPPSVTSTQSPELLSTGQQQSTTSPSLSQLEQDTLKELERVKEIEKVNAVNVKTAVYGDDGKLKGVSKGVDVPVWYDENIAYQINKQSRALWKTDVYDAYALGNIKEGSDLYNWVENQIKNYGGMTKSDFDAYKSNLRSYRSELENRLKNIEDLKSKGGEVIGGRSLLRGGEEYFVSLPSRSVTNGSVGISGTGNTVGISGTRSVGISGQVTTGKVVSESLQSKGLPALVTNTTKNLNYTPVSLGVVPVDPNMLSPEYRFKVKDSSGREVEVTAKEYANEMAKQNKMVKFYIKDGKLFTEEYNFYRGYYGTGEDLRQSLLKDKRDFTLSRDQSGKTVVVYDGKGYDINLFSQLVTRMGGSVDIKQQNGKESISVKFPSSSEIRQAEIEAETENLITGTPFLKDVVKANIPIVSDLPKATVEGAIGLYKTGQRFASGETDVVDTAKAYVGYQLRIAEPVLTATAIGTTVKALSTAKLAMPAVQRVVFDFGKNYALLTGATVAIEAGTAAITGENVINKLQRGESGKFVTDPGYGLQKTLLFMGASKLASTVGLATPLAAKSEYVRNAVVSAVSASLYTQSYGRTPEQKTELALAGAAIGGSLGVGMTYLTNKIGRVTFDLATVVEQKGGNQLKYNVKGIELSLARNDKVGGIYVGRMNDKIGVFVNEKPVFGMTVKSSPGTTIANQPASYYNTPLLAKAEAPDFFKAVYSTKEVAKKAMLSTDRLKQNLMQFSPKGPDIAVRASKENLSLKGSTVNRALYGEKGYFASQPSARKSFKVHEIDLEGATSQMGLKRFVSYLKQQGYSDIKVKQEKVLGVSGEEIADKVVITAKEPMSGKYLKSVPVSSNTVTFDISIPKPTMFNEPQHLVYKYVPYYSRSVKLDSQKSITVLSPETSTANLMARIGVRGNKLVSLKGEEKDIRDLASAYEMVGKRPVVEVSRMPSRPVTNLPGKASSQISGIKSSPEKSQTVTLLHSRVTSTTSYRLPSRVPVSSYVVASRGSQFSSFNKGSSAVSSMSSVMKSLSSGSSVSKPSGSSISKLSRSSISKSSSSSILSSMVSRSSRSSTSSSSVSSSSVSSSPSSVSKAGSMGYWFSGQPVLPIGLGIGFGGGGGGSYRSKSAGKTSAERKYRPSLIAAVVGIYGKKEYGTGLSIRPLVRESVKNNQVTGFTRSVNGKQAVSRKRGAKSK